MKLSDDEGLREIESLAMNIVHLVGRIQHGKVPNSITSKAFVDIRQASNDEAIDAAMALIYQKTAEAYKKGYIDGGIAGLTTKQDTKEVK